MTTYDEVTDLPTERHQPPSDIPKATPIVIGDHSFDAAKVKITGGMSEYALDNPPAIGDERTYIVKASCTKHHVDEVDGEPRLIVEMKHYTIYDRDRGPLNEGDRNQGALFDEAGDVEEVDQ